MEKIALITDTTCDLDDEIIKKYNIHLLPFNIIYKDREYKDRFEITPREIYEGFEREVPTSSLPSMLDMERLYEKLAAEGYTHAIAITLSSGLSGIFNAMKLVSSEQEKIVTYLYDSKSISYGEGLMVMHCGDMIKSGKSFNEIVEELPRYNKKIHLFFVVGTLEYLKKGGRIGRLSGTLGELLHIKPIVSIDEHGVYYSYDKVRGRKQSLSRLVEIADKMTENMKMKAYILHGNCEDEANKVTENLSKLTNIISAEMKGEISPVAGVHSGPGLIGLLLLEE